MSDSNLIQTITAWGTRKQCKVDELLEAYGSINSEALYKQLRRLANEDKISLEVNEVYLARIPV